MGNYITLSLELHLFFLRIMKEHSFFLEAGFLSKDEGFVKRAEWFREQFEEMLEETVKFSDGMVNRSVLDSQEIVTPFTRKAEEKTCKLTGLPIDTRITLAEQNLKCGSNIRFTREMQMRVRGLNRKALTLVRGLIELKEDTLRAMRSCELFTFNYPLLIEHIIREAKLYGSFLMELEQRGTISVQCMRTTETFWNQIMMEHALFIRGLLDPSEEELIDTADGFAKDFRCLLEEAREKDCAAMEDLTGRTIAETKKYQEFKTAGTKGILGCEISGLILPLLADHVLREANHYLRLLEEGTSFAECGKSRSNQPMKRSGNTRANQSKERCGNTRANQSEESCGNTGANQLAERCNNTRASQSMERYGNSSRTNYSTEGCGNT